MKTLDEALEAYCQKVGKKAAEIKELLLDGKCKALSPNLQALSKFENLEVLTLANTSLNTLSGMPALQHLKTLRLSDNKLQGGTLKNLSGLVSLRRLDLAGNNISKLEDIESLVPLTALKQLDLDGCPVSQLKDVHKKIFTILTSLEYLDSVDKNGDEREVDEDEEEEEEEEEEEQDDVEENLSEEGEGEDQEGEEEEEEEDDSEEEEEPKEEEGAEEAIKKRKREET